MSPNISLRLSPNPGAFTAQIWSVPRSLLTTSAASASPSMSSATISSGLPALATCSSKGRSSFKLDSLRSCRRMKPSSSTTSMRAASVAKYGDR